MDHRLRVRIVDEFQLQSGSGVGCSALFAVQSFVISSGSPQPSKTSFFAELLAPEIRLR